MATAVVAGLVCVACLVGMTLTGGLPSLGLGALLLCAAVLGVRSAWGLATDSVPAEVVPTPGAATSSDGLADVENLGGLRPFLGELPASDDATDDASAIASEQQTRETVVAEQDARSAEIAAPIVDTDDDHDPATGLWSRRALERTLAAAVSEERWAYPGRVVMLVVLDDFNTIVAEHGREIGREVFASAAQRLTACLRPGDMAVRHGIDGFAVLLEANAVMTTARPVAERVIMAMAFPFMVNDQFVAMGACVGLTVSNGDLTPDGLLLTGIGAASIAKRAGRGHIIQVT